MGCPRICLPIPSDRSGSDSRFKGMPKHRKKLLARIRILSEGGEVRLSSFDSEEEASIMLVQARYKHSEQLLNPPKPCPLDLSDVRMNLPPISSDTSGSASHFKGGVQEWEEMAGTSLDPIRRRRCIPGHLRRGGEGGKRSDMHYYNMPASSRESKVPRLASPPSGKIWLPAIFPHSW